MMTNLNKVFFDELEIRQPDYYLDAAKESAVETIAQIISKIDPVIAKEKPDAILLYGDTNSCPFLHSRKEEKNSFISYGSR